jgi:hypothetical protein
MARAHDRGRGLGRLRRLTRGWPAGPSWPTSTWKQVGDADLPVERVKLDGAHPGIGAVESHL